MQIRVPMRFGNLILSAAKGGLYAFLIDRDFLRHDLKTDMIATPTPTAQKVNTFRQFTTSSSSP